MADASVELEDRIAAAARRPLASALDKLLAQVTAEYVRDFGSLDADPDPARLRAFQARLASRLGSLPRGPSASRLLGQLADARQFGVDQAARDIGADERPASRPGRLSRDITREARAMTARVTDHQDAARRLLSANGISGYSDVVAVVARARQSLTALDRTVRWAANRSIAEGASEVAERENVSRVWVPEREACLHCLKYAGQVAKAGEDFPAGLTFGDKPLDEDPVPNPPLHPNCRCRIQLWRGDGREGEVTFPEGLVREAERVVLLGRSEHASEPARLRAAEALLNQNPTAPKTVKKKAAAAVRAGRFTTP